MDRAAFLGVLGGSLTSIAGLLGYLVLPVLSGDRYWSEMGWQAYQAFTSSPYGYHAVVLVVPSLVGTFAGALWLRNVGRSSREGEAKLVAWNVALPTAAAVGAYVFSSVVLAGAFAVGASGILEGIGGFAVFFSFGLLFGAVFASVVVTGVLIATLAGSASGYVLARGVDYGRKIAREL